MWSFYPMFVSPISTPIIFNPTLVHSWLIYVQHNVSKQKSVLCVSHSIVNIDKFINIYIWTMNYTPEWILVVNWLICNLHVIHFCILKLNYLKIVFWSLYNKFIIIQFCNLWYSKFGCYSQNLNFLKNKIVI